MNIRIFGLYSFYHTLMYTHMHEHTHTHTHTNTDTNTHTDTEKHTHARHKHTHTPGFLSGFWSREDILGSMCTETVITYQHCKIDTNLMDTSLMNLKF